MIDRVGGGLKDYVPVMLRMGLAAIFIVQGAFSLTRLHGGSSTKTILIAVVEILGGLFCLMGFLTRWAACALAILILFIIVDDHQWGVFYLRDSQPYLAYFVLAVASYGLGGGKWSVDEGKKSKKD
jgi:uncharacterized membrane protein YphA (DoxX/SURF4 family)